MKRSSIWLAVAGCVYGAGATAADPQEQGVPIPKEYMLVTVPLHKKEAETALPVTVLSGDELHARMAATLGATLQQSPGLSSASFGPGVGQPVIRGQQGPRVRVLQNGVANADASGVSADHAVTVEPLLAESVEVLRGPATLLYGGGAIGGVVNVIDNRIPRARPEAGISGAIEQRHDSATDGNTSVFKLDGGVGSIAWHLDGVYRDWNEVDIPGLAFNRATVDDLDESSDGYIANSDGRNHTLSGGLSWIFDRGHIGFSVSDMRNKYGIPSGGHVHGGEGHGDEDHDHGDEGDDHDEHADEAHHGGDIRIDLRQTRYDLAGELRELGAGIEALRWRLAYSDYKHSEWEGAEKATTFTNETWEGRFEAVHAELAGWHGVLGLQLKDTDFAALGEEAFIPPSTTRSVGVFLLEDHHRGDWVYELGLRLDRDRIDPAGEALREQSFNNVGASAAALWNFHAEWSLGLALSGSQRAPTVEELFSNAGAAERHNDHFHYHDAVVHAASRSVEVGNAELEQETSRNLDVTLRYGGAGANGYVTAFYNDFRDFIFLANTGFEYAEVPVLEYQQEDARFHGVEFELKLPLAALGGGDVGIDFYGDWVRGRLADSGDVPRMPPWRLGTRLNFSSGAVGA
jgi:iron complex outermembrane receptor protein